MCIYIHPSLVRYMSTIQQQKLKKLFPLSFFTLLMVASLLVISGGEQQQSFSQPSEQDTNSATTTQSTDFLTYDMPHMA
jgi:uncharacterized protein YpmS